MSLPPGFFKDKDQEKEFYTLQGKLYDTARQINVAKQTVALKAQNKKRNEMTKIELGKVSPSTPAFKAVGRMFIQTSIVNAQNELEQKANTSAQEIVTLQKNIDALEKQRVQDENSIKDLMEKNLPAK